MRKLLQVAALAVGLGLSAAPARAESVTMTVDRPTALNFMRAATPYSFDVNLSGFKQRLTLLNPRELRFEAGNIRLKVDCHGETTGASTVLEPTLAIYFDRQKNAFVAKVQSLPLSLGALGTVNLDQYLQPFVLPVSFSQTLEEGIPGLTIDYLIRDIKVLDERIEAKADLVFRRQPPRAATTGR